MGRLGIGLGFLAALGIAASVSTGREAPGNDVRMRAAYPTIGGACNEPGPAYSRDLGRMVWCVQSKWTDLTPGGLGAAWKLRGTLTKIAKGTTDAPSNLVVMLSGDSVGGVFTEQILTQLRRAFGSAGFATTVGYPLAFGNLSQTTAGGTDCNPTFDYTSFFTGTFCVVPSAGTVAWGVGGGYAPATEIKVLYLKEPGAGTFHVDTQTTGSGAWDSRATDVNAAAASKSTGVVTISGLAQTSYKVRVTGATGSVKIIGVSMTDPTINGIVEAYLARGGLAWNDAVSTPRAIMDPWLAAVTPDLLFLHTKEMASYFAASLETYYDMMYAANPLLDVVAIGSPPQGGDHSDTDQVAQNVQLRTATVSRGGLYWDAHVAMGDYATAVAYGWMNGVDGVHPTILASEAYGSVLWQELFGGLSTLKESRPVNTTTVTSQTFEVRKDTTKIASAGTIGTDTFNVDLLLYPTRAVRGSYASADFFSLAASNTGMGYTANFLPVFRTQNANLTKGPWIKSSADGSRVSIGAAGSGTTLAPIEASRVYAGTVWTGTGSNTDLAGTGTLAAGSFTYTFTETYTAAPVCVATDMTAANPVRVQVSTTELTVTGTGTDQINFICNARY